jgi:thiol-disulfide isomerase/thioredoxin
MKDIRDPRSFVMNSRPFALAFCAFCFSAAAQTTPPAQPEAARPEAAKPAEEKKKPETPPDSKAYQEANKIADPEKKIEALEKFKHDFPESQMQDAADESILSTLVKKLPDQTARIRRQAAGMYAHAKEKDKGYTAYNIADEFLSGNVLLKDAEGYARKGVDSMLLSTYLKEQLDGYEKRKQKAPSSEELQGRFKQSRASRLAVYGQVELKLGHAAKAKKLLEESYAGNANNGTVLSALGVMASKTGDETKALDYLIPARLSGRASKEAGEAFEAIYKKQHSGSLEGVEAMLDSEYRKRYPNPVKIETYKPGEKRSDRVVLAEVFTGSGCPPCTGADLAFDAAMERYAHKDLAVLMFHQHIPRPDPMTNPDTVARAKSYEVGGVPTFVIDGKKASGGGPREYARTVYERFNKDIESDLEKPAEAHITIGAWLKDKTVGVNAAVRGVAGETKDVKVQIALVEKEQRFNGENGIRFHPMVVRAMAGKDGAGFAYAGERYEQKFDLDEISKAIKTHLDDYEAKGHRGEPFTFLEKKYQINPNDLAVVVFVQDDKTKHVLQAAYVELAPEATHPTTESHGQK